MELIIVIAIMAILIGVLAPQYVKYVEKTRKSSDEDLADTLLTAGYLMAADEDIAVNITKGDKIQLDNTSISITEQSGSPVTDGLDEFAPEWRSKRTISKAYKDQEYVVEFQGGDGNDAFTVTGSWIQAP